ncbi:hypothetical protein FB645_001500 [Coemansia sp. IMI 203386]|nr:hypothetical protein FB645_001500 [Coemansia sp. IMI 203386]
MSFDNDGNSNSIKPLPSPIATDSQQPTHSSCSGSSQSVKGASAGVFPRLLPSRGFSLSFKDLAQQHSQLSAERARNIYLDNSQSKSKAFFEKTKSIGRKVKSLVTGHPNVVSGQESHSEKSVRKSFIDIISNRKFPLFSIHINSMKAHNRLVHIAKLSQNRIICNGNVYDEHHALGIPDIMLNASSSYKTAMTTVPSNQVLDTKYLNDVPPHLTYQLIPMATRPEIVKTLRLRILYMGQKKKLGGTLRFNQLERVHYDNDVSRNSLCIQFIEPSRSDYNVLTSGSGSGSGSGSTGMSGGLSSALFIEGGGISDPATIMDPFIITGPRHIGKSHIMFNLAARMAADPGVVVMYISNASDLLVKAKEDRQRKYTQFVEYIACAFCEYEDINGMVDEWYYSTEISNKEDKLRDATHALLHRVRDLCENYQGDGHRSKPQKGITPIVFIDRYELLADANPYDCIVTVINLALTYGFQVILSTSDPASYQMHPQSYIGQCVISTPLSVKEARRLAVAVSGQLKISKQDINRIFNAADYHPADIAGILQTCQMYSTSLTTETIKGIISEHRFHRRGRLVAMHADFVQNIMDAELNAMESREIKKVGAARRTIDSNMPELLRKRRDIMRTPFMLYHRIDFRPGTVYDPQFLIKDPGHERKRDRNNGIRCMPYAAIEAMYKYHFQGSVQEQFSWLLSEAVYHFEIDQPIRSRYFDLVLLETEQLSLTLTNPLNNYQWSETLYFRALTPHTYFDMDEDYGDPGECLYFTDAVNYVTNYIALDKKNLPSPHRIAVSGMSVLIYFPNLTFVNKPQSDKQADDSWIDQALAANTSFSGTFMVCVTRDNIFVDKMYQSCEYRVSWIASDPLTVTSSSTIARATAETAEQRKVAQQRAAAQQFEENENNRSMERDNYRSPKDTRDYDTSYGYVESWSAKAFRLFPALRKRCVDAIPDGSIKSVKMLALAENKRASGILEEKQLVSRTADLAQFDYERSTDIGLMSINKLSFFKNIRQYYVEAQS